VQILAARKVIGFGAKVLLSQRREEVALPLKERTTDSDASGYAL
jgi:hypothetical protein